MANQTYYIGIENDVLELERKLQELQEVLHIERVQNSDTGKLSPENYDAQGTLRINMLALIRRAQRIADIIEKTSDDVLYAR
jgi:hypothetical protein